MLSLIYEGEVQYGVCGGCVWEADGTSLPPAGRAGAWGLTFQCAAAGLGSLVILGVQREFPI